MSTDLQVLSLLPLFRQKDLVNYRDFFSSEPSGILTLARRAGILWGDDQKGYRIEEPIRSDYIAQLYSDKPELFRAIIERFCSNFVPTDLRSTMGTLWPLQVETLRYLLPQSRSVALENLRQFMITSTDREILSTAEITLESQIKHLPGGEKLWSDLRDELFRRSLNSVLEGLGPA